MFDFELLQQSLRRVMIETVTAHNRAMVQLNRSKYLEFYYWRGESSSKSDEFFRYACWETEYRAATESAISSLIKRKLADRLISHTSIRNSVGWIEDAEFALRAQTSRNLLWALSQSFQFLPSLQDNCWYAGAKKNGYLLELRDRNNPTESEFGRYVVGRRDGRFLRFTEREGWKIYEFDLKQTYCVDVRRARSTEIYFDESLDDVAKHLASKKIKGDPRFRYPYKQWEDVCAPQYALPL
jgi:hypothetical protein